LAKRPNRQCIPPPADIDPHDIAQHFTHPSKGKVLPGMQIAVFKAQREKIDIFSLNVFLQDWLSSIL